MLRKLLIVYGKMFKLFDFGLRGKIWKMIYNSYENFKCMVLVNGVLSDTFDVERGVHQGAPLSMRLYQIFNNDLLKELNEHVMTLKVYQHKIGSPAFADDVVVTAKSKRTMNILLEVASTHAHKWRYKFNPQKCVYMMFGQDKEPEVAVVFGTSTVKQVENTLYLGVPLRLRMGRMKKK